jgi:uncharacterized protein (AIM24 family)
METSMGTLSSSSSSMFQTGFTRIMTGQNLMISDFRYIPPHTTATSSTAAATTTTTQPTDKAEEEEEEEFGTVCLGTEFPAKILKFELSSSHHHPYHDKLICQKGAYLAGSQDVTINMAYVKSFAGGFFGGEGFILQSLQVEGGEGVSLSSSSSSSSSSSGQYSSTTTTSTVFLKAYGTVIKRDLRSGEKLRVSSGSLVCMTSTVEYDVTMMTGFANVVFGGQGLFVTTLTGPGTVWLQSMPVDKMVSEIARRIPSGGGIGLGIPIMGGGGVGGGGGDSVAGVDGDTTVGSTDHVGEGVEGNDSGVSAMTTDAAVDADRNATIASSAGSSSSSPDPESPESLFGDVAFGGGSGGASSGMESSSSSITSSEFNEGTDEDNGDFSLQQPSTATNDDVPEFDESTISEGDLFEDDGTTFSTYDGGGNDAPEMPPTPPDGGEGSSSILGQLWDLFRDFTDRD